MTSGHFARLPHEIKFYEKDEDFYEFTNFWECDHLEIPEGSGTKWRTTEHYFQAMKFAARPDLVERCRRLATPRECFDMVRDPQYKPFVRQDWHHKYPTATDRPIKDQVMHNAVMAKFTQDKVLKKLLVSTAHGGVKRMIIEHTTNDDYWGDNGVPHWRVGDPGNMLGQLLVEVREKIMSKKVAFYALPQPPPPSSQPAPRPAPAAGGGGAGHGHGAGRPADPRLCAFCQQKPRHGVHPWCGRHCAGEATRQGWSPDGRPPGGRHAGGGGPAHAPAPAPPPAHAPAPPAGTQLMQVTCPPNTWPGATVTINAPGQQLQVQVPAGVSPGQVFSVSVPAAPAAGVVAAPAPHGAAVAPYGNAHNR